VHAKVRKIALQLFGVTVVGFANSSIMIEMTGPIELPPELQRVDDLLSKQPPGVRDLSRYLLVMSMVDAHKAKIVGARAMRGRHYVKIETNGGDVFRILRPRISMGTELRMREEVKAVLEEHDD
jgi:hypothetical protein